MDLTSHSLYDTYTARAAGRLLREERAELRQRRALWAYYLLRRCSSASSRSPDPNSDSHHHCSLQPRCRGLGGHF